MKNLTLGYIKQAIINEIEGYEFYRMAASTCRDEVIKETYLSLAEEERKHVVWLRELHNQIEGKGNEIALEAIEAPPSPDIFNWNNLDREDPKTRLSVFGIALQLEKASYEFYKKVQGEVDDEVVVELFKILESWERVHYETFDKEYKLLKEQWWHDQGFAPF